MSKRFEGKAALVTGAARGQGRAHAVGLAREGANVAVCDILAHIDTVPYGLAGGDDLAETVRLCEAEGATVVWDKVDVRDYAQVKAFADKAIAELGQIHVLVANAAIFGIGRLTDLTEEEFGNVIDVNLKGVWHTAKAVVPHMEQHQYGRVVMTASIAGLGGFPNVGHYVASKHAVIGMMKSLAVEQAANGITVNAVCPSNVHTLMIDNEATRNLMSPDDGSQEAVLAVLQSMHAIPKPWIEPEDVTPLVLFLASDEASYITGAEMKIDLGAMAT